MGIIGRSAVADAQLIAVFQQRLDGVRVMLQFIECHKEGGAGVVCFQTGADIRGSGGIGHAVEGKANLTGRGIYHFPNGGFFTGILTAQRADRARGKRGNPGTPEGRGKIQPFHTLRLFLKGGGILNAGNQIKSAGDGLCRIVRLHRKQPQLPGSGTKGGYGLLGSSLLDQQQPGIAGQGGGIPHRFIQPVKDPVRGQPVQLRRRDKGAKGAARGGKPQNILLAVSRFLTG